MPRRLAGSGSVKDMSSETVDPSLSTIRVFHHWACSGGTLLSRSLAIQPQIVLLSEVHPLAYLRHQDPEYGFMPTDLIQQLCLTHNGKDPAFCLAAWNGAIDALNRELTSAGKLLVLRSHSHVDFFTGILPESDAIVSRTLRPRHRLLELLSVRHPLDSWLSMHREGWDRHFRFSCFAEFCRRCLSMLDACRGMAMIRYEDFCLNPQAGLALMAEAFEFTLERGCLERIGEVRLSGDSGRTDHVIGLRPRRPVPKELVCQLSEQLAADPSKSPYLKLCKHLGYNPEPESDPFATLQSLDSPYSDGAADASRSENTKISLEQSYFESYNQQAREYERLHEQKMVDLGAKLKDQHQESLRQQQENNVLQQQIAKAQQELSEAYSKLDDAHSMLEQLQVQLGELSEFQLQARHSYKTHFRLLLSETANRLRRLKKMNH
jgi:hypothetical protein